MLTHRHLPAILCLLAALLQACQATGTPAAGETGTTPVDASLSAELSEVSGSVNMHQPGVADFAPATDGDRLRVGAQVQTGVDGRARLDLSSGTVVRIAPTSLFTLVANQPAPGDGLATRIRIEFGKIFIILSGGSLEVETPAGLASVRGSYMMTETLPGGGVLITCLEGTCELETLGGRITLGDGQAAEVQNAGQAPVARQMSPEEVQDWLDHNPEAILVVPTDTPIPTPTDTPIPAEDDGVSSPSGGCFKLLAPASGSAFGDQGAVTFRWETMPGAVEYRLSFDIPGGYGASFRGDATSHRRFLASLALGGTYSWSVTAYDAGGEELCTAGPWTFTKEAYIPTDTPVPTKRRVEPPPEETETAW